MRATSRPFRRAVSPGEPLPRCLGEKTRPAFALGLGSAVDAGEQLLVEGNVHSNRFTGKIELDCAHQYGIGKIGRGLGVGANGVDIAHDRKSDTFARQRPNMGGERFTPPAQRLIERPTTGDAPREIRKRDAVSSRLAMNKCNDGGHARRALSVLPSHHFQPATR